MNLECLNDIITSNLAIHIDLTDLNSWDLNTGLTSISLTKWSGAVTDNIDLIDFGLTGFDNGRTDVMWSGITLTPQDNLFSMFRVGFNNITNPTTAETSGMTITTEYLPITAVTTGSSGNYFNLNGGYLQGFFKLEDYNYELLPARFGNGVTIETILYLNPDSQGIFYMMGARAEDKYNPYFSGETLTGTTTTGVITSFENYLNALQPHNILKDAFAYPEDMYNTEYSEATPLDNIKNNVIAFELTQDNKLAYKYVDDNGLVITNTSPRSINPTTGWTIIAVVFTPDEILEDDELECAPQRLGKLMFYVNGRAVWTIKDFPEYYFHGFDNDKEKQIGVPYSISWGGGSFGLGESWHYDYQSYVIYNRQDTTYIDSTFTVEADPIPTDCYTPATGSTYLNGLSLSADTTTFTYSDACDPDTILPLTVMRVEYTGGTGNTYFIKFNQPISVLSNRNYVAELSVYVGGIFNSDADSNISILVYSDNTDIDIVTETEYQYPLTNAYFYEQQALGLNPFPDGQEYEFVIDKVMYYGATGYPVPRQYALAGSDYPDYVLSDYVVTGNESWMDLKTVFRTPDNTGQNFITLGLLITSTQELISGGTIYINDFKYTAADILVQDDRKSDLTIEQNFDSGFVGGIQKLRVYDKAFSSAEILHNAKMEAISDPNKNVLISKGGRIIYR